MFDQRALRFRGFSVLGVYDLILWVSLGCRISEAIIPFLSAVLKAKAPVES